MNTVKLEGLDRALQQFEGLEGKVKRAARLSINSAARRYRTEGSRLIRQEVKLKASYVNKHLKAVPARGDKLEARISATRRPVLLSRYGAKQLTRKAKSTRAKGDAYRGIAAGRKAAGVSVAVKHGRKKMRGAFLIRLRAGRYNDAGAWGVALRTGQGRDAYKILHGPSVDQLWRDVRVDIAPGVSAYVSQEFLRQLDRLL